MYRNLQSHQYQLTCRHFLVPETPAQITWYYHRAHTALSQFIWYLQQKPREFQNCREKLCIQRQSFKAVTSAIEVRCIYLKSDRTRDFISYQLLANNICDNGTVLKQSWNVNWNNQCFPFKQGAYHSAQIIHKIFPCSRGYWQHCLTSLSEKVKIILISTLNIKTS